MSKTQTQAQSAPTANGNNGPSLTDSHMAACEQQERYQSAGPLYVGTGIVGDVSAEFGFQTGEGSSLQRSGIGIYLRTDHLAKRKPLVDLFAMANPEAATAG